MKRLTKRQREAKERNVSIVRMYVSGLYTTEQIARKFSITERQIQRVAAKYGVIRTQAEANRIAAPLKNYHTVADEFKVRRKHLSLKTRFQVLAAHPYCVICGMRPDEGVRLEVDHIDENAENNDLKNLQVLCGRCNLGKSHVARFPVT